MRSLPTFQIYFIGNTTHVKVRLRKTSQMKSGKKYSEHHFIQIFKKVLNNLQKGVVFNPRALEFLMVHIME